MAKARVNVCCCREYSCVTDPRAQTEGKMAKPFLVHYGCWQCVQKTSTVALWPKACSPTGTVLLRLAKPASWVQPISQTQPRQSVPNSPAASFSRMQKPCSCVQLYVTNTRASRLPRPLQPRPPDLSFCLSFLLSPPQAGPSLWSHAWSWQR